MAQKLLINCNDIKGGKYESNVYILLTVHRILAIDCWFYPFYFSVNTERASSTCGSFYSPQKSLYIFLTIILVVHQQIVAGHLT